MHREIRDALQPNLRPTGVPTHRAFLYATWQPVSRLRITPSLELADDRWSEVNPAPAFPYVKTGAYALLDLDATYALPRVRRASASGSRTCSTTTTSWRGGTRNPAARST